MSENKKFNTTVIALWETKTGNAMSMTVDARSFDQLQKAIDSFEIGGKFIVKRVPEESRAKFKNPETAPTFFLEFISKAQVQEFEAKNPRNRDSGGL